MPKPSDKDPKGLLKFHSNRSMCTVCGEYFSSDRAFSIHRVGEFPNGRRCKTPKEMKGVGFHRDENAIWRRAWGTAR